MGEKIWFICVIWICFKRKGNFINFDKKDGLDDIMLACKLIIDKLFYGFFLYENLLSM